MLLIRNESGAEIVREDHLLLTAPSSQPSPTGRGSHAVLPIRNESGAEIVREDHLLLTGPHPSPLPRGEGVERCSLSGTRAVLRW
ncbi:hypothetical protein GCM10022405_07050 [Gibbsiella dentisursi]|uniref:Uncharacterized protein n=1 Tax=Gibbsiella dentisursi TaxID=796890 RepID=A0ABP7KRZ5_9GAMM